MNKKSILINTKEWLENRYDQKDGKKYVSHQPIYGFSHNALDYTESLQHQKLARNISLIRELSNYDFNTFLDIGSSEGHFGACVKELFNADVTITDISVNALKMANKIFKLKGVVADATCLPFKDNSFDMVFSAEVIEHLENPFSMINEMIRVSKSGIIISTSEAAGNYLSARLRQLLLPPRKKLHGHISVWTRKDFVSVLGEKVKTNTQAKGIFPKHLLLNLKEFCKTIALEQPSYPDGVGITAHLNFNNKKTKRRKYSDKSIIEFLLNFKVPLRDYSKDRYIEIDNDFIEGLLCCPNCRDNLSRMKNNVYCLGCKKTYYSTDGIIDFFQIESINFNHNLNQSKAKRYLLKRTKQFDSDLRITNPRIKRYIKKIIYFL